MVGLVVEARLGVLEDGDVGEHADEVGDLAGVVAHGADGQPLRVGFAAFAAVPDLTLPVALVRQLVPHGDEEGAVMLAGGEQARGLAEGFGLAVAGDLGEGAVDCGDALLGVGDQHAFGGVLEHGGGLLQFLLHHLALGDVAGDGQHADFVADEDALHRHFAEPQLLATGADRGDEVAHAALVQQALDHAQAIVGVGPDAELQGRLVGGL
ncbi:hypothetical protein D9M68_474000 [compost metagenome]